MRLTIFITIFVVVQTFASSMAQNLSLQRSHITFRELFNVIQEQTGYQVVYPADDVDDNWVVRADYKNTPLTDVMRQLLYGKPFDFAIKNKTIVIRYYKVKFDQVAHAEKHVYVQQTISGIVADTLGAPLSGVTVSIKGTNKPATITNEKGQFSFLLNKPSTLVFQLLGFATTQMAAKPGDQLHIVMKEESGLLDEIVVVGYGTQKKVNLTGAIATVTADDISSRPSSTATNAIQGLMPGVTVTSKSGQPGSSNASIRIRGIGSLNNSNPLVLIDGFEGSLDNLNSEDIANISVLKDAASSSIYGSRAANGVVLVTTKSGKNHSPQLTYTGYAGFQSPTKLPKYLGSVQYMQLRGEAETNSGKPITYSAEDIQKVINGTDPNFYANTDWIDAIYRKNALQQNHNLNLQGGSDNVDYFLSYGYLDQNGNVVGNAFGAKKHNIRLKLGAKLWARLKLDGNIGYVDKTSLSPAEKISGNSGLLYITLRNSPLVPVHFTDGSWGYGGGASNSIAMATDGGQYTQTSQDLTGNVSASLEILSGLSAKVQYGTVISNWRGNRFTKKITYTNPETGQFWYQDRSTNLLEVADNNSRYQSVIAQADYDKHWNKHQLHLLAGFSQEWQVSDTLFASRQGVISNELSSLNLGTLNQQNSAVAYQWAIRSGFSRLNYSFDDKYLFEFNMRYDGSSRFAKNNRWGLFPSLSAGWRLSQEPFIQSWLPKSIDELKLRGSWGKLGNQYLDANSFTNASLYPYLSLYEAQKTEAIGGELTQAYGVQTLYNRNITWESSTMTDVGIDLQLFKNKLAITADYFVKNTNDILLRVPLPDVIGLGEPSVNAGAVQNKGWEVQVNWQQKLEEISYSIGFNLSDVRNKVTNLGGVAPTYGDQIRMLNKPIDAFYGLVSDGLAQQSDFTYNETTKTYTPLYPVISADKAYLAPGDVKYKDLNNDGEITLEGDRKVIGSSLPRYTYGIRGNLGYKNFDVSFFLQGVGKADGYIQGVGRHAFTSSVAYPQVEHLDRWTTDNTNASYPRLTYNQNFNTRFSSYWLENAAYLRLKNIQVGYTLPKAISERIKLDRLRIYLSADNIFTFTDFFKSYDPETPVSDGGFYPQVKTVVLGLNLSFK